MATLLTTEWLKMRKYRAFWWMTGIIALSYPGINYLFHKLYRDLAGKTDRTGAMIRRLGNPYTFPEVWHTVAFFSSWFIFIPSIIIIMFITNEYTYKTHRQNIIDGWSRRQFLLSKLIDLLVITLLVSLMYIIVSLVIGYVNTGDGVKVNVWEGSEYIFYFALQTFSQLSIAFLIAFLARKAFIALGIFLFYFIILEPVIVGVAKAKANDIGRFMPLEISDRIVPLPAFLGVMDEKAYRQQMVSIDNHIIYTLILVAVTWAVCFWINNRRDL
ncbi:MAG TPA: ABC transporter permease [Flavisolibacter sp.]